MRVRGRGLRWACLPALAAPAAAALFIGTSAKSASLLTCTDNQLVPRIAELLVSQGAPGYTATGFKLARGKETIVRAYLTTPTGCSLSNKQSITPVTAKVDVTYSNPLTAPSQTAPTCAAGTCSNYAPLFGKLAATTQISSTSDPFFVIPDFYLAPDTNNPAAFDITFTLKITYNRTTSTGTTSVTTTGTEMNAQKMVSVDQRTNALRILVVPMGDPTSTSIQWSTPANTSGTTAERVLQDAMTNAARAFPVPSGATPELTPTTTGGIRYVISTSLLNAQSLGLYNSGKFCANGANWSTSQVTNSSSPIFGHTLKGDLLQRLADYNALNNPPADMVLGVVDGAIAAKSTDTSPSGCDDGRAATPASRATGQVAWVRVSRDSYPTPLEMELMHPFGIVNPAVSASFHSLNVESDGVAPGKGYNVLQRKVVDAAPGALGTNDHSIMNYNTSSIPYTKDNTLLEPRDWKDALCDLGGVDSVPLFQNCTLNTALGTSAGVAANDTMYQISGILTSGGTNIRVTDGKVTTGDANVPLGEATDSPLHLKLYKYTVSSPTLDCGSPLVPLQDIPLATYGGEGHHGLSGAVGQETTGDSFGALVPLSGLAAGAQRAELWLGTDMKFSASQCDAAPDILSTSLAGQETTAPGTIVRRFNLPAGNGRAIAFDPTNHFLYASLAGSSTVYKLNMDGSVASSFNVGTTIGALAYNVSTGHLYGGDYTGNGKVYDIDPGNPDGKQTLFTFSDSATCVGSSNYIDGLEYRSAGAGQFAISGDICNTVFYKDLLGNTPSSANCPVAGSSETCQFSTVNNSGITTDGGGGLWLARLTQGNAEYTQLTHVDSSGSPLGDDLILSGYAAEDLAYDSVTFAPTCVLWMNQATFFEPQPEVRAVAVPCGDAGANKGAVGVQTTNARFVSVQFTCGNPSVNDDARPTFTLANGLVPGTEGSVIAPFTNQLFCGESPGKIISTASNGWQWTGLTDPQATVTATGTWTEPTGNIASPLDGSKYRRGEFIHYEGSAFDAFSGAIVAGLTWKFDGTAIAAGTQSFDKKLVAADNLGPHTITLEATDGSHTASTTVKINVGQAGCASTANCP